MAQLQKVGWRTVGYALLGSAIAIAAVVAIIRSDGVRPTSLTSSAATRWLVYQPTHRVVLADGLSGRVLARIDATSDATDEVAVQGAGGAFLVARSQGSVRTISTAMLQLGTPQAVPSLSENVRFNQLGVGASGLTVVDALASGATIVAVDDVARPIEVPDATYSRVAGDGSIWLFTNLQATHVNVDESSKTMALRGPLNPSLVTTVGSHAVSFDSSARIVHWLDGGDVPVGSIANSADAVLQEPGDDAPCVWLGAGDTLACIGPTGIDRTIAIDGMNIGPGDRFAVAGSAAVVVRQDKQVDRIDLEGKKLLSGDAPTVSSNADLAITATDDMIWIDDLAGSNAWAIHGFGINTINKADETAPLLDAQGQVKSGGTGGDQPLLGGNEPGDAAGADQLDLNGHDDPPVAVDDSVTARSGNSVTIPVTANDYDPDGDAIAVVEVQAPGHGTTDVLDGTSVAYVPAFGFSGTDTFEYTIVDEHGNTATANVSVTLFAPDSPNQPPIARADRVKTRPGVPIIIDVLANDIDPERDVLSVSAFQPEQDSSATITEALGPTRLPALQYLPPPGIAGVGINTFTYQAADPQGGTSAKTKVTVEVVSSDTPNGAPDVRPDAIRLPVGVTRPLNVLANDVDPDNDKLIIDVASSPRGVQVGVRSNQLEITLQPGADPLSVIVYRVHDGIDSHDQEGRVLVVRIGDTAENRSPVANPDTERVVIGTSVKVPVTANDIDPDSDTIRLLTVTQPARGVGTTTVEGEFVRFKPNLPNITEPTPVSFTYQIGDGNGHTAIGRVTVTVLAEALPQAPFAGDDLADTVVDKSVNIDVRANDSDPSGGQPTLVGAVVCPNGGEASTTPDQRVTFTPPLGRTGIFRCLYRVTNTQGLTDEASIIVTVTEPPPGNQQPVINQSATSGIVNVGGSIRFDANTLATDPDGDQLIFVAVGKPDFGSVDRGPDSLIYIAPGPDSTEIPSSASFDVVISDENGGNVPAAISIVINSAPPAASKPVTTDITGSVSLGDTAQINVPAELSGLNPGAILTVISATADAGSDASVTNTSSVVSITPAAIGTVSVTYVVANGDLQEASGKITLTVIEPPLDNPPVARNDALTVASGSSGSVNVLQNDEGIFDVGDQVSVTLNSSRPPAAFGTVSLDSRSGNLAFNAAAGADGDFPLTYTLTDGHGTTSTATIALTILPCSESTPAARAASVFTPYQTPIDIDLTQYVLSGRIRPGSINGAGLTGPTGTYTPPAGMNSAEIVTYLVENGCRQTAQGTLVIDVNRVPVGGTIDRIMSGGTVLTLVVSDLASDDEVLSITAINANPAWVTFDGTTITAAPPSNAANGTYTFNATVADPGGLTATATIHLTISNRAPVAVADSYTTTASLFSFDPTLNDFDPEGGPVYVQTVAWIDGSGTIYRSPDPVNPCDPPNNLITVPLQHGVSTLSYTIRDCGGLTASSTVTITSNNPPTVEDVDQTTNQTTLHIDLVASDPDGDSLAVTCSPPPDFDVQVNGIDLDIRVLNGFVGTQEFLCWITDTFNATDQFKVKLTVTGDPTPQ